MTNLREANTWLVWGLPLAGLLIGLAYFYFGKGTEAGSQLILEEMREPRRTIPLRMAPFTFFGTLATHLFGGSAGREGTAVQMGAALADFSSRHLRLEAGERRTLLLAGAGAGFGAAIGTPWAGAVFGVEMLGHLHLLGAMECVVASFSGFVVSKLVGAPHSHFPAFVLPSMTLATWGAVLVAGLIFGIAARGFVGLAHAVERTQKRWVSYPPLRPLLGGILVLTLFQCLGTLRYAGLGIEVIQRALVSGGQPGDPFWKAILTALTVGSGFKGGEFIPLVFIGTTLGSLLSLWLPASLPLLASLGFAAVFGAAANTPLACSLMAAELFGWGAFPYALLSCLIACMVSGTAGIYRGQVLPLWKLEHWLRKGDEK